MIELADELFGRDGVVIGISSDAAVQHYETWGPYGASKAVLDDLVLTFGEETGLRRTPWTRRHARHTHQQAAFPREDISHRTPARGRGATAARAPAATNGPRVVYLAAESAPRGAVTAVASA